MQCIAPVDIINKRFASQSRFNPNINSILAVPCGKCPVCLENRRSDWSLRLAIELEHSNGAKFITLTYNDDNIYHNDLGHPSVEKTEMQNYMKRLRKTTNAKLRYYTIGEYGTKSQRPHYHILLFNYPTNQDHHIVDSWTVDGISKGFTQIGTVTPASIHYVTKYHVNKTCYPEFANPPFALMSIGIGKQYITQKKKQHEGNLKRAHYTDFGGTIRRLPRYLKDKLYTKQERDKITSAYQALQDAHEEEKHYQHSRFNPCKNFYELEQEAKADMWRTFKEKNNENDKF